MTNNYTQTEILMRQCTHTLRVSAEASIKIQAEVHHFVTILEHKDLQNHRCKGEGIYPLQCLTMGKASAL